MQPEIQKIFILFSRKVPDPLRNIPSSYYNKDVKSSSRPLRLYNLIFPVYLALLVSPVLWLFLIAGNFLVDSVVVLAGLSFLHQKSLFAVWKRSILRVVFIGFFSDLVGSLTNGLLWTTVLDPLDTLLLHNGLNPYDWPGCALEAIPAIAVAMVLILVLDRRFAFRKTGLKPDAIRRLSLSLALFTAPWVMLIPLEAWTSLFALFSRL